jgi:hypothetical protein
LQVVRLMHPQSCYIVPRRKVEVGKFDAINIAKPHKGAGIRRNARYFEMANLDVLRVTYHQRQRRQRCPDSRHLVRDEGSQVQSDDLRGLSILLVEDSPVVADALNLELFGATAAGPAATMAEAREAIMAGRPDVVLVDFHLWGENSYT